MKRSTQLLLLLLLVIESFRSNAAICTELGNGNWSNPANWSCGALPGCGDIIVIPAGITVNVDMQVDLDENSSPACSTATIIDVSGTLQFVTGNKISLACGSGVEVMTGGSMLPGGGGGASSWLKICEVTEWQTSDGPVFGFKLFGAPSPLPVEFVSFDVAKNGSAIEFEWIVASERDNDNFTVEYSEDGKKWITIVTENSIGDHVSMHKYTSDAVISSHAGVLYFRLKQTDLNGTTKILDETSLKVHQEFKMYPNPVKSGALVEMSFSSESDTEVLVYNALGQLVKRQLVDAHESGSVKLETEGMRRGVYLVKIPSIGKEKVYRLIVE